MGDASRLDVSDEDPLAAAVSCGTETDHAEAQTAREGPGQPNQLCVTTLFSHTHTHRHTFSTFGAHRPICACSSAHLGGVKDPLLQVVL